MNRLRELREDRDMTQEDVGKILGVSKMSICRYEKAGATIPNDLIGQLCNFYNVTADYLLGLSSSPFPAVSELDTAVLAAYHAAPDDLRAVVDFILKLN